MKLKNVAILIFTLSFLIIALSVAYYLVVYTPQQERVKLETQKQNEKVAAEEKRQRKSDLDFCLILAGSSTSSFWDSECEGKGLGKDCLLPTYNADRVDTYEKNLKQDCFKKYPQ